MTTTDQNVVSMSRQDLLGWASDSLAFFEVDLSRLSTIILAQIFGFEKRRLFSTFDLTDPIKALEGLSLRDVTPPPDQFKHAPLTGLYKKHFTSAHFLAKNLLNFTQSKKGEQLLHKTWQEATAMNTSGKAGAEFFAYLTHKMTMVPFETKNQSGTMTGEWIVFHKYQDKNYYLTPASHTESNEQIYSRVALACQFDKLPFSI